MYFVFIPVLHSVQLLWKQGPWFVIDMSTKHLSGKWPAFV